MAWPVARVDPDRLAVAWRSSRSSSPRHQRQGRSDRGLVRLRVCHRRSSPGCFARVGPRFNVARQAEFRGGSRSRRRALTADSERIEQVFVARGTAGSRLPADCVRRPSEGQGCHLRTAGRVASSLRAGLAGRRHAPRRCYAQFRVRALVGRSRSARPTSASSRHEREQAGRACSPLSTAISPVGRSTMRADPRSSRSEISGA